MYNPALVILGLAAAAQAHMHLHWPPTLKGDNNPNTKTPDQFLNYPYACCGRPNPGNCKGHLDLLDTDEGKSVVTWNPGSTVNFTLSGEPIKNTKDTVNGGTHYGGSCQVGFSLDKGKTFTVAKTWQGNCPLREGSVDPTTQTFDFRVPADIPSGNAVFAWTWVNREKEFNMNCASVTIAGGNVENPEQPKQSSTAASRVPSPTVTPEKPSSGPSKTNSATPQPTGDKSQFTLQGCTCACPYQTWSSACTCYDCDSSTTKRHLVERAALVVHKRNLRNAARLNVPVRRAEAVAFSSRPKMLTSIDFPGAECHSLGNPVELEFPDPGPDVDDGDKEYTVKPPTC